MEIGPDRVIRPSSFRHASPAALKSWQAGRILSAPVAGVSAKRSATLRINPLPLNAQTSPCTPAWP
jgi:hypothetical protein